MESSRAMPLTHILVQCTSLSVSTAQVLTSVILRGGVNVMYPSCTLSCLCMMLSSFMHSLVKNSKRGCFASRDSVNEPKLVHWALGYHYQMLLSMSSMLLSMLNSLSMSFVRCCQFDLLCRKDTYRSFQ